MAGKMEIETGVVNRVSGTTEEESRLVVDAVFASITELLKDGNEVQISQFGTFVVRTAGEGDADRTVVFSPDSGILN